MHRRRRWRRQWPDGSCPCRRGRSTSAGAHRRSSSRWAMAAISCARPMSGVGGVGKWVAGGAADDGARGPVASCAATASSRSQRQIIRTPQVGFAEPASRLAVGVPVTALGLGFAPAAEVADGAGVAETALAGLFEPLSPGRTAGVGARVAIDGSGRRPSKPSRRVWKSASAGTGSRQDRRRPKLGSGRVVFRRPRTAGSPFRGPSDRRCPAPARGPTRESCCRTRG